MEKLMRVGSTQRGPRESLPVVNETPLQARKWSNLMPLFLLLVVVAEIAFLGRLDMAKDMGVADSWVDLFHRSQASTEVAMGGAEDSPLGIETGDGRSESEPGSCEEWLEREDRVVYSRDFNKDPILVSGAEEGWKSCSVGCSFGDRLERKADAVFGIPQPEGTASVHRSMESAQYYKDNNIAQARRWQSRLCCFHCCPKPHLHILISEQHFALQNCVALAGLPSIPPPDTLLYSLFSVQGRKLFESL